MEFLWNTYGAWREQLAGNRLATRQQHAFPGPALSEPSRYSLHSPASLRNAAEPNHPRPRRDRNLTPQLLPPAWPTLQMMLSANTYASLSGHRVAAQGRNHKKSFIAAGKNLKRQV